MSGAGVTRARAVPQWAFTGADWSAESNHPSAFSGHEVSIAGDVNGDGHSDVIVGADQYGNSGTADGAASLYYSNGGGRPGSLAAPGASRRPDAESDRVPGNRLGLTAGRWFYGPAHSGTEISFRAEDGAITGLEARSDSPTILGHPTTLSARADQVYVSYTWDFGDGATGSGRVVTHTYPSTGTHTAIVTGTNTVDLAVAQTNVTVDYVHVPLVLGSFVSHFRGPWEVEDNDTTSTANGPLASGQDYYGYPDDADDYFSVYMPKAGTLTIDLTNHVGQGVQVQLFYQSTSVMVTYDWNPPYHIVHAGSPGWYYVRIYTASGYTGATPYTLRVTYP